MPEEARVLVFGAGSVGSLLGGFLAKAGYKVTLLARPQRVRAIAEYGLKIDGLWGTFHVRSNLEPVESAARLAGQRYKVVLVTVKSYDTRAAAETLARCEVLFDAVVSVQNGYGNVELLAEHLDRRKVLGARIITGVDTISPSHVRVTVSADALRIGPPFRDVDNWTLAERVVRLLQSAGIPAETTPDYQAYLWDKILYNAALNPLGALLAARYGELAEHPGVRRIMERVIREAYRVLEAHEIPRFSRSADEYLDRFFGQLVPQTASHFPSMLADLQLRGRTEIEALNGAIARLARKAGFRAPVNEMLTAMVQLRERTRQRELRGNHEL